MSSRQSLNSRAIGGSLARSSAAKGLYSSPQYLSVVLLGFVMPMGKDATPNWLNDQRIAGTLAAISIVSSLFSFALSVPSNEGSRLRPTFILIASYATILAATTFVRDLPENRLRLFALFAVGFLAFVALERRWQGGWLQVIWTVSALHVSWACLFGDRTPIASGVDRLSGGTSPVLLGFESAAVVLLALLFLQRSVERRLRIFYWFMIALALYALFSSFSRAAIIALVGGLVVFFVYSTGRSVAVKFGYSLVFLGLAYFVAWPLILGFLGGADPASVLNASGRYDIWPRLILNSDAPLTGYGFGALYDGKGPDWYLFELNNGLPSENSLLQAYLMGGVLAAFSWLAFFTFAWLSAARVRVETKGLSIGFALLVLVDAMYGIGQSGQSNSWWWLLGCISVYEYCKAETRVYDSSS